MATIFEQIGNMTKQFGAEASQFRLDYQDASDDAVEGDMVPVITLALRPATLKPAE